MTSDAADLARFDKLGPKSRHLIQYSPKDIDVGHMLRDFMALRADVIARANDMDKAAEEFDASRDERLAEFLLKQIRDKFPLWDGPI